MSTSVSGDDGGVLHCWVAVARRGKGGGEWGISCRRLQMSTCFWRQWGSSSLLGSGSNEGEREGGMGNIM